MIKKYILIVLFFLTGIPILKAFPVRNISSQGSTENRMQNTYLRKVNFLISENISYPESIDQFYLEEENIWSADGSIYVRAVNESEVQIYTITGQLSKKVKVTAGETAIPMSRGLYIVRLNNITRKVIVR